VRPDLKSIRIIDAFTDRPFAGNPAGVCLLDGDDDWPGDDWLRAIAAATVGITAEAGPVPVGVGQNGHSCTTGN
jgi:hypothetical protein